MKHVIIIGLFLLIAGSVFSQIQITKARIINDNGGTKTVGYTITTTSNVKVLRGDYFFYEGRKGDPDSTNTSVDMALYRHAVTLNRTVKKGDQKEDTVLANNIKDDHVTNSHDPILKQHISHKLFLYGKLYYVNAAGKNAVYTFKIKLK